MTVRQWAAAAALGGAVVAAHGGAVKGEFHYDDLSVVVNNPAVRSWQPSRMFTGGDAVNSERDAAIYRPLMALSLAVNHVVSGLDPSGYLATNLALHVLAAWLIVLIGYEVWDDKRWAWCAGLVFALHPVNAESVNYVTARSSLLSTIFALAATWAYIRYVESKGGPAMGVLALAAFVAAMLSKESAVVVVAPLAAYGWFRSRASRAQANLARARRAALAFGAMAVLYVAFWRIMTAGGVAAPGPPSDRPAWTFAELAGRSLALWVWPWPLGLDHPLTFLTRFDGELAAVLVLGAVGFVVAFVALSRRVPVAAWGLLWALVGLAPLAPLPWLTTVALFQEHRIGFSAAGLSLATAALAREIWTGVASWHAAVVIRRFLAGIGAVLVVAAVAVDRARSAVWNDDRRLWAEVVERSPDNLLARINLGSAYMMHREYGRAKAVFEEVLVLVPSYYRAHYNLGLLALRQNLTDEATAAFQRAVHLNPQDADAQANLGILALRAGDTRTAEALFRIALDLNPTQRDALNNLATIHLQRREFAVALDLVTAALRRDPEFLEASYNQGVALAGLGRHAEAAVVLRDMRGRLPPGPAFDRYRTAIDHLLAGGAP
ncbi:MAG: tetratricopeptide repeat protein [Nitrospirota bacterium]